MSISRPYFICFSRDAKLTIFIFTKILKITTAVPKIPKKSQSHKSLLIPDTERRRLSVPSSGGFDSKHPAPFYNAKDTKTLSCSAPLDFISREILTTFMYTNVSSFA